MPLQTLPHNDIGRLKWAHLPKCISQGPLMWYSKTESRSPEFNHFFPMHII